MGEEGTIGPVPVAEVERALEEIAEHRDPSADPIEVAVSYSGPPSGDDLAAYGRAGVSWVLVAGWIDELDGLVELVNS